jgi:uncharacterized protein (DUF433 family)
VGGWLSAGWYNLGTEKGGSLMSKSLLKRITSDPEICHGKPTVRGLRYPVETLLELMASGMSMEEILEDYEDLEREDLLAVLQYASRLSKVKSIQAFDAA